MFGFSLLYPAELTVDEYDEGGGARTIVFRNAQDDFGFQVFITLFAGPPISKADIVASDPRAQISTITRATVGTSTPAFTLTINVPGFGPSRELWFSNNGHVFQVSTYPTLANWLASIFATLQFTN